MFASNSASASRGFSTRARKPALKIWLKSLYYHDGGSWPVFVNQVKVWSRSSFAGVGDLAVNERRPFEMIPLEWKSNLRGFHPVIILNDHRYP